MAAIHLDIAIGAYDKDAGGGQLPRQELERARRGPVGPVKVVQHQHERLGLRRREQEPGERVEEAERRLYAAGGRTAAARPSLIPPMAITGRADRAQTSRSASIPATR